MGSIAADPAAWSAVYSLQFEFGPLSEAAIGNVGMRPETTGWVDHAVTPVGAFGLIVAEDALDRFFVTWVEERTTNRVWRAALRLIFNPGREASDILAPRIEAITRLYVALRYGVNAKSEWARDMTNLIAQFRPRKSGSN